jgi:uncharacterized membrane protein
VADYNGGMEKLRLIYIGISLLMIVLAIPLMARKVPPNPLYGFRTARTLSDAEFWYEVNAFCGKLMLVLGICLTAAAFGLPRVPGISVDGYAYAFLGVLVGVGVVDMILGVVEYRKIKAMMDEQE